MPNPIPSPTIDLAKDLAKARELLSDAAYMLRTIEAARQLPPFAQAQQQYVALGKRIQEYLDQ